jgi:uncharacterized protein (TIGR04222 family)
MNVFDLRGPEFLEFYVIILAGAVVVGVILRCRLRSPGGSVSDIDPPLDPYEIAYLAGGPQMAVDAAIACLIHTGALGLTTSSSNFKTGEAQTESRYPLQQSLLARVSLGRSSPKLLHRDAAELTQPIAVRLVRSNLALSPSQAIGVRLVPALVIALILVIGVVKINVGIARGKPVGLLTLLCLLTLGVASFFAFARIYRTRAGDLVLRQLRIRSSALRSTAGTSPQRLDGDSLAFALALFGPTILTSGSLLTLRQALWPSSQSGGGGSSSGCGSSGCGSSGCGGGGCGGGGCGGCGGG